AGTGEELPAKHRIPMQVDTIFDTASVTKLFTAILTLQFVEQGKIELTDPVMRYLPEFGVHGKHDVTVQELLTHTAGLEPSVPLWRTGPDPAARINVVLEI